MKITVLLHLSLIDR